MIYLYVKTHNVTGLKYLGKTKNEPYKYKGSGTYWYKHIKKHGYNVTTEIIYESEDKEDIVSAGLYYSLFYDVVKSDKWANLMEEKGDGGFSLSTQLAQLEKVKNGTHIFLSQNGGSKRTSYYNLKRSKEGENTFCDKEKQKERAIKRTTDGKNPFSKENGGSELAKRANIKMFAEGKHSSQKKLTCPICNKIGHGKVMMYRWHFDNCKFKKHQPSQ